MYENQSDADDMEKKNSFQAKASFLSNGEDENILLSGENAFESRTGLWNSNSLNLLARLNTIRPFSSDELVFHSDTMLQDKMELSNCLKNTRENKRQGPGRINTYTIKKEFHAYEDPLRRESRFLRDLALTKRRSQSSKTRTKQKSSETRLAKSSSKLGRFYFSLAKS